MLARRLGMLVLGSLVIGCAAKLTDDPQVDASTGTSTDHDDDDSGSSTSGVGDNTGSTTVADASSGSDESSTGTSTGEPVCPDVGGMYYVGYDIAQPNVCRDALTTTNACGVTQVGCTLHWGCNGAFENYLPPGPLSEDGIYYGEGTFDGGPFTCTITFGLEHSFEWECITATGTVCTGGGF